LYLAVASASAMIIVNTVIYVRESLNGSETDVAIALAAAGAGSMLAALSLPKLLDRVADRPVMLTGGITMAVGVGLIATAPSFLQMLPVWFLVGLGWSLVQTPAGRVVNRSSSSADRSAYFSAQFALSHACWLIFYLVAGESGTCFGVETTALLLSVCIVGFTLLAARLWPKQDLSTLTHDHPEMFHEHKHVHDEHHDHDHEGWEGPEPHSHPHRHKATRHSHTYVIDDHHATWPNSP
ncbi:MAG: MFS transporter, partial [Chromatiales bacterium]|nr:MFS transporter [Chromatiales bacterium]